MTIRRTRLRKLAVILTCAVLGAVAGGGAFSGCSDKALQVSTVPAGAAVQLDGMHVGYTPGTWHVDPGVHDVSLQLAGFRSKSLRVDVAATSRLDEVLEPLEARAVDPIAQLVTALGYGRIHREWTITATGEASRDRMRPARRTLWDRNTLPMLPVEYGETLVLYPRGLLGPNVPQVVEVQFGWSWSGDDAKLTIDAFDESIDLATISDLHVIESVSIPDAVAKRLASTPGAFDVIVRSSKGDEVRSTFELLPRSSTSARELADLDARLCGARPWVAHAVRAAAEYQLSYYSSAYYSACRAFADEPECAYACEVAWMSQHRLGLVARNVQIIPIGADMHPEAR